MAIAHTTPPRSAPHQPAAAPAVSQRLARAAVAAAHGHRHRLDDRQRHLRAAAEHRGRRGAGAVLIGWLVSGVGMLCLAFVYQTLAWRQPALDNGVYAYARASAGEYVGFNAAWGYWVSAWIGNVGYLVILFGALGIFFPAFGEGNTPRRSSRASVLLWVMHFLILRGVHGAAVFNAITTVAKVLPLLLFLAIVLLAFQTPVFTADFWGKPELGSVMDQVKSTMLVTVWAFIGIEGASVVSGRAKSRADVGRATLLGFVVVLALLMGVSLLSLGILSQPELAALKNPSMAGVLERAAGPWGGPLHHHRDAGLGRRRAAGVDAARRRDAVPPGARRRGAEVAGAGERARRAGVGAVDHQRPGAVVPDHHAGVQRHLPGADHAGHIDDPRALPAQRRACGGERVGLEGLRSGRERALRGRDMALGGVALAYCVWLLYAAGLKYLLLAALLYAPGALLFAWARREQGRPVFKGIEWALFIALRGAGGRRGRGAVQRRDQAVTASPAKSAA